MHSVSRPKVFGQHSASNEAVAEPTPNSQRRSPERGSSFSLGPNTSNSNKKRVNNASPPKSKRIRLKNPLKQFNDASGMKISTDDLKNSHSTSTLTLLFFETELQAALENGLKEAERTKQVVEQSLGNQSDAEDEGWFDEYIDDNCVWDPLELGSEDSEIYSEEGPAVDYFSAEGGCGALAEQSTPLKAGVAKRDRIKAPADTQQRFDAAIQHLSKFNNDKDPGKK
ncbi:MAG: hypothetical protein ON057_001723 [Glomeribacter sp. 1016415]|nr:hypothetical protein [Glomeribacter sp. 1016415]